MNQVDPTSLSCTDTIEEPRQEITHVPLWVKGIVAVGAILFAMRIPSFPSSLTDAIQKNQAGEAYGNEQYAQAANLYKDLHTRYPSDKNIVRRLGLSCYHADLYIEAINAFHQLEGIKMSKRDVDEINAAISDMATKLNSETR
jgi:hypothetical protein